MITFLMILVTIAVLSVPVLFCIFTPHTIHQEKVVITGNVPIHFAPPHSWQERMYDGRIVTYTMTKNGPRVDKVA